MTSTTDADDAPRPRRRTAAAPAPDAAPPSTTDAAPPVRKRRTVAKATEPTAPSAPAASPEPTPAPRVRRTRAKADETSPAATPTAMPASIPASIPAAAASAPSAAATAASEPTTARRPRTRTAKAADDTASAVPAAPPIAAAAPPAGAPPRVEGMDARGAGDRSNDAPSDRPVDGDRPVGPVDGNGDGRREGYRTNRRRRRGRGDGTREPGGYARGPVPPTGDVIRPRETTNEPRARDPQQPGGWRRDDAIRDTRRTDAGRVGPRDGGTRYGNTARDDRRTGGQQQGGQQQGGQSQGGQQQGGQQQGGQSQGGQRQGGQSQSDSRYGGGRSGQQGGGQQGTGQAGGGRHDGGRTGGRQDSARGGGRVEGRGRHTGPFRERDAQRPPAGPPEDWDAPAPGGLEVGGHAGADWVSYEDRIAAEEARRPAGQQVTGYIELSKNGNGILRAGGLAGRTDPVMPMRLLRQYGLRSGDLVDGLARGTQVVEVNQVNGHDPVDLAKRPHFDTLTAVHPDKALLLGATADNLTGRLLDLVAPVGRGQRGLIVAPPKAGKTTLLKDMANGLAHDPKLTLLICLVGERPEEVTDMRRSTNCTVLAADMDLPTEDHTRVAEICVEHAKRLVEEGKHVVILMDSLTRLARAYNLSIKGGGSRTLSGGMDAGALQPVRKFFGAARCAEGGGSLTILATCLVDTGSRLDDLVYEEFKGTGNMEVHLDRKLSELRLFPAVDIRRSGTRREELLFDAKMLEQVHTLRRQLAPLEPAAALTAMLDALRKQAMPDGSLAGR
ncbi:MAG: transcription termination factor Rho [Ardenticatenales bacterium]|nr:transcription termination factor Rho [Ardenticatenales bacterium]